ncbi:NAD(P)-binding protein [Tolypocladium capitatum]|uniref:NAD(P)-binding protein n=1 Tax=Tolypocladium capitatum TaxID=45235 RepID=A0A2K3QQ38_9HYPO|nr:NAD(P)-binding protein [Tolypocladium capitatum]
MAPIRTAIVGLSASAITSWASSAHLPYLLSARGRAKYTIVALCNSSVDAAKRAIATYKLAPETRAYGDPQALADDEDIDLVVCCTRVDVHHQTILPSVKAGKSVFVEWPLAQDVAHAQELVAAADASGSRSLVGLQGRVSPAVAQLRQLLHQRRIGKVLSSEVKAFGGSLDRQLLSSGLKYFTDLDVGGNIVTIGFGHCEIWGPATPPQSRSTDNCAYSHVLGDLTDVRARLQLQRPEVKLRDASTGQVTDWTRSDVPDLVIAIGVLTASDIAQEGATVLVSFRRGQPFLRSPGLVWTVNGEKGEIRLVAQGGPTLHSSTYTEPVTLEVHDFQSDTVEPVGWSWDEWQTELPINGRSIATLYDLFAEGKADGAVPSIEDALARHVQLEKLLQTWPRSR